MSHVMFAASVEEYLAAIEGLSDEGKRTVIQGCETDLATRPEHFQERYPLGHESYRFEYEFALVEGSRGYSFRFIVDGSQMAVGVIQVIYVDYETIDFPGP